MVAGWSYQELLLLYAVLTLGFGLGVGIMGNCTRLSQIIAEGHLDFYLTLPKNVLLHVLVSRMNVGASCMVLVVRSLGPIPSCC